MDYFKQRTEFYEMLTMHGRHVLTEKTIDFWRECDSNMFNTNTSFRVWLQMEMPKIANIKLWRMIALAQGIRKETKDAAMVFLLNDIETKAVEIIIARRKEVNHIS